MRRAKLLPPRLPADAVRRPSLEARLERATDAPLTLVAAGAGFGKTTLVSAWAGATARRGAWLSVDAEDADLRRFLRHLLAALRTVAPEIAPAVDDLLGGSRELDPKTAAALLGDELLDLPGEVVLVLDDLHQVAGAPPAALLSHLLRHPPPDLRVVATSRVDLAELGLKLPGSLRVETLRERDLRLGETEIGALLGAGSALAAADVAQRTDGWAAGVRALAVAGDAASTVRVRDYLAEDVLAGQPPELTAFLRDIAILERMSPELAGAVAGVSAQRAAAALRQAERRGLFVSRLDGAGAWWRIHPLLRDVLLADLRARGEVETRHGRAAGWFADARMVEETVDHALRAGDPVAAADLLEERLLRWLSGDGEVPLDWIDRLPPERVRERPALLVARAAMLVWRGNQPAAETALAGAEALLAARDPAGDLPETRLLRREMTFIRGQAANVGGDPAAILDGQWALVAGAPGTVRRQRASAPAAWGMGMVLLGRGEEALATLAPLSLAELEVRDEVAALYLLGVVGVSLMLADLDATARWNALAAELAHATGSAQGQTWTAVADAVIAAETGDILAVEAAARAALPLAPGRFFTPKSQLSTLLARSLLAQGRVDEARTVAAQDRRRIELAGALGLLPGVAALEAEIALAAGDREAAWRWADAARPEFRPDALRLVDHPAASQARIWLDRAGPGDAARAVAALSALRDHEAATHHRPTLARTLPLLAVAQAAAGDPAAALATMREALAIEPGAMTRRFADADMGPGAFPLLAAIAADAADPLAERAARMLRAAHPAPAAAPEPAAHPASPLTPRQAEILEMVAGMRTNKEIGEALGITAISARDHVKRILRRLGVGDRRTAVEVARAAGWIDGGAQGVGSRE